MKFSVTLSDNEKYILCVVSGEFTSAEAQKFSAEMDEVSRLSRCKKFLMDMRNAKNVSNVLDNFEFAYNEMERLHLQRDVRLAVLHSPGDHSHDFVNTVISNAGYYLKAFQGKGDAVTWL